MIIKLTLTFFTLILLSSVSLFASESTTQVLGVSDLTCKELFKLMNEKKKSTRFQNPDLIIKPMNMEQGQIIYITKKALASHPEIQEKAQEIERVTFIKRGPSDTYHLESESLGGFSISLYKIIGNIYKTRNFHLRSPYTPGEYVQIGGDKDTINRFEAENTPRVFTFKDEEGISSAQYLGSFVRAYDKDNYIIQVTFKFPVFESANLIVPKTKVFPLPFGTEKIAQNSLSVFSNIKLSFERDEPIRYRDFKGRIKSGVFVHSFSQSETWIKTAEGEHLELDKDQVFKQSGEKRPFTPAYSTSIHNYPKGLYRQFLNGAAKITSLNEYNQANSKKRLEMLVRYAKESVQWKKTAKYAEQAGFDSLNSLLCTGVGVCRHSSLILAAALTESGHETRVLLYTYKEEKKGHAWLEVDIPLENGEVETFVVDPSVADTTFVKTFSEVMRIANKYKDSTEAIYYTHPGRKVLHAHELK